MEHEALIAEVAHLLPDINLDVKTARKLSVQGFNSAAFEISSSTGPTVLHIVAEPLPEQKRQKMPEKLHAIATFLTHNPEIPTAIMLAHGYFEDGSYYLLQNKLPGSALGSQDIVNDEIVRSYTISDPQSLITETEQILANLHTLSPCKKFGHLTANEDGVLSAKYESWNAFLTTESKRWINVLREHAKEEARQRVEVLAEYIEKIFENYSHVFSWKKPKFVHGDMINPGNILAENGEITAILDFEWAVSGDPAWEFAFTPEFPGADYFTKTKEPAESFEERKRVYRIFWLTWGAHVHAHKSDTFFRDWLLRKALEACRAI